MTSLPFPLPLPLPHPYQLPTSSHPSLSEASNLPSPKPSNRRRRRRRRSRRSEPTLCSVVSTEKEEKAGTKIILPDDMLFEILIRTDVETLWTIRSVCKKWRAILSDPFFISQHHLKAKCFRGFLVVEYLYQNKYFLRDPYLPPSCCGPLPSLDFMPAKINAMTMEAFTPHGLLLCSDMSKYDLYVCKPTTREWIQIPIRKDHLSHTARMVLAVAPTSRLRFRIMRVYRVSKNRFRLLVFDSDSWGEWKELAVDQDILNSISIMNRSSNLVNGHFCWLSSRERWIVCVDVWTGKVELIMLGEWGKVSLANINNGLGLIREEEGVTEYWRLRSITMDRTWEKQGSLRLHDCVMANSHDHITIVHGVVLENACINRTYYYIPHFLYRW